MLYAIAKGMDQNVVALHAANGMLDKDADATQGGSGSSLSRTREVRGTIVDQVNRVNGQC